MEERSWPFTYLRQTSSPSRLAQLGDLEDDETKQQSILGAASDAKRLKAPRQFPRKSESLRAVVDEYRGVEKKWCAAWEEEEEVSLHLHLHLPSSGVFDDAVWSPQSHKIVTTTWQAATTV
jgi:hypothetical protein